MALSGVGQIPERAQVMQVSVGNPPGLRFLRAGSLARAQFRAADRAPPSATAAADRKPPLAVRADEDSHLEPPVHALTQKIHSSTFLGTYRGPKSGPQPVRLQSSWQESAVTTAHPSP